MSSDNIKLFEDKRIRTAWDEANEEWLFYVVDVVAVLTDQATQRSASTKKTSVNPSFRGSFFCWNYFMLCFCSSFCSNCYEPM